MTVVNFMPNMDVVYLPQEAVKEAVDQFETPFFLYEEKRLRANCQRFKGAFEKYFDGFEALFAVKANPNPEILKIVMDEGFGLDCSSPAEAHVAKKLGTTGMYTGNYTPSDELKYAAECGMLLNLDDMSMIPFLEDIGVPEVLSFRINPGVGDGERESFVTAGPNAKYGVPFERAAEAYAAARDLGVKRFGIHMMTGTNIPLDKKDYFAEIVKKLFKIVADIKRETGVEIELMNIGGGFGVPYRPEEKSLDINEVAKGVREVFDEQCAKYDLKEPRLMAEPGRWIAADAGWLVSKVIVIKDSYKKFVGIDASSNDMPRPSIYGAYHYATVLNDSKEVEEVSVVGRICENNDQLARDRKLPKCSVGDVVVIHNCGGHAFSMGHNYNGRLRHAEYLIKAGDDVSHPGGGAKNGFQQIRRAETIGDYFKTVNF